MNESANETIEYHGDWQCQFMDLDAHVKDCSTQQPKVCLVCLTSGKFFTGESIADHYSTGQLLCLAMWFLTLLIGTLGVITNPFIIGVIRARKVYRPFDYLLMILACFDTFTCAAAISSMTSHVARYQSWVANNEFVVYWFYISNISLLLGRTGSTYMTILIAIERCLVIAFPIRSKSWFTSGKTTFLVLLVVPISLVLNCPRFIIGYVGPNYHKGVESLKNFQYLLRYFSIDRRKFCVNLGGYHNFLDFWAPLPILLFFNGLSFVLVRKIPARRQSMNVVQQKEIDAFRMFTPVVATLIITNIAPIIHIYPIIFWDTLYRELISFFGLSVAINSAVNFHIFRRQSSTFQKESKAWLGLWFGRLRSRFAANEEVEMNRHATMRI